MQTNQEIEEEIIRLKSEITSVLFSHDIEGFVRISQKISALGKILAARREADDALNGGGKTGAPGRPSSMHLVRAEAEQRRKTGQAALPVEDEAKALHSWFKNTHPAGPLPTAKTIENRIREDHRAWRKTRN
jgi:hypothetical protein